MEFIQIHAAQCTRCGTCVTVCPSAVLTMSPESAAVSQPNLCISCGHCAMICPENAITCHENNPRTPFKVEEFSPHPEESLFQKRRSIRHFTGAQLDESHIGKIIEMGERAPSSHNFRDRQYYVVTDADTIRQMEKLVVKVFRPLAKLLNPVVLKLIRLVSKQSAVAMTELSYAFKSLLVEHAAGKMPVFRNAPCAIFITGPKDYDQSKDDCIAAQNYMMLYAASQGIGSCIMGYAQYPHKKLARFLGIPKNRRLHAVTIFGYPKHPFKRTVEYRPPSITWNPGHS